MSGPFEVFLGLCLGLRNSLPSHSSHLLFSNLIRFFVHSGFLNIAHESGILLIGYKLPVLSEEELSSIEFINSSICVGSQQAPASGGIHAALGTQRPQSEVDFRSSVLVTTTFPLDEVMVISFHRVPHSASVLKVTVKFIPK